MLSALDAAGRTGLTAVGHSAADAQHRFEQARNVLLDAATTVAGRTNAQAKPPIAAAA